ncbi:hypothetical protein Tco_1442528, partial [Tanacetum coccineum]
MADKKTKSTMKEFTTNDHEDYYLGITCITVNGKNAYELNGKFLDDLHNNAFDGTNGEDAVKLIEYFLRIPTCGWRNDGFCNGGNLPVAYIIRNSLHYQYYEWYEALEDSELKEEALRNKAIMEGLIDDDNDDESCYERKKRWNIYDDTNHDHKHEIDHEADKREELCEIHEISVS